MLRSVLALLKSVAMFPLTSAEPEFHPFYFYNSLRGSLGRGGEAGKCGFNACERSLESCAGLSG